MNEQSIPLPDEASEKSNKRVPLWKKLLDVFFVCILSFLPCAFAIVLLPMFGFPPIASTCIVLSVPVLICSMVLGFKKKGSMTVWGICLGLLLIFSYVELRINAYDESITINTTPSINVREYLPYEEDSKIVKLDNAALHFTHGLPILDGAAAVFPVYSAFVHAVYPDNYQLGWTSFQYNNTTKGYRLLAERETDIFFGAYPSDEQIAYAEKCGTTFEYTPIGLEAFVFFVHKDNPIDNLTTEQIKAIYSGEITNWKQLGGKNKSISAYQRNTGSGSQSMLIRFMDGTPIMEATTETIIDSMGGIIEQTAHYRNKDNSIGFSFRYYMEGMIQNPDVKLLSIDGVAPTPENIRNGTYPITTYLYAVTYEGNDNENVARLIEWVLSAEGQYIIGETGYTPIKE